MTTFGVKIAAVRLTVSIPALFLLSLLLFPSPTSAAGVQIQGRVFTQFGPLEGAQVQVFQTYEDLSADKPVLVSRPADERGFYSMQLEPGKYYFTATGRVGGKTYSAYHGANPITVSTKNLWISLMANERKEPAYSEGETSVQGIVVYKGKPVKGAYVAFYTLDTKNFKGLGFLAEKGLGFMKAVGDDGTFSIPLSPGKYVVIARDVKGGNVIRPLQKGDLFCYTPANPIEVKADRTVRIEIPCYPKALRMAFVDTPKIKTNDFLSPDAPSKDGGIKGKVTDSKGQPIPNVYVIAYRTGNISTPTREAEQITTTDADGRYFIPLAEDGKYGLVVRSTLGAAPGPNDITGIYSKDPLQGITYHAGTLIENMDITIPENDRKLFE